jgi:hypothetical protein
VFAPDPAGVGSTPLAPAPGEPAPSEALTEVEEAVGEAKSVTSQIERGLELFTALAQGQVLDRKFVVKEADALLNLLERLDRDRRYRDVLRVARVLAAILALTLRWVALVETLRIAVRAARELGEHFDEAWALHELGTVSLVSEDAAAATNQLGEALRIRKELHDEAGAEVTRHNLATLERAFAKPGPSKAVIAAIVAGALLLIAGGAAVAVWLLSDDEPPPAVDTVGPETRITDGPDESTEERSASFVFEADEPARAFQCRLDAGSFAECVSPQNYPGPLSIAAHVFNVRAVDLAGNVGEPAVHEWTIVPGEGPSVSISGPEELTRQTVARFVIEAPGAVRLECALDGDDFESCSSPVTYEVEEGEHTFTARAFGPSDAEGPASDYRWTVDTTGPSITIDPADLTAPTTAVLTFEIGEDAEVVCTLTPIGVAGEEDSDEQCGSPKTYENLAEQTAYQFRVVATDAAGNQTTENVSFRTESEPEG